MPDPLFDLENAPAFTPRRSPSPIDAAAGLFSRARRLPLADASLAPCAAPLLQSLADSSTGQCAHACFSLPRTALRPFLCSTSRFISPRARTPPAIAIPPKPHCPINSSQRRHLLPIP